MEETTTKYQIWQPFLLSAMVAFGIVLGFKMNESTDLPFVSEMELEGQKPIGEIEEVLRFIENKYVDSVDRDEIYKNAFDAVFSKLDPHSLYISPEEVSRINAEMNGQYVGIGVEVFQLDDTVYITKVTKNSPAEKAGLKKLDKLISIENINVAGQNLSFDTIRGYLKKEIGQKLEVNVKRNKSNVNVIVEVDNIGISSVEDVVKISDSISFIKINRFSNKTYKEFMDQLEFLVNEKKLRHIIIDLRGNPGGYLPEAVNILSQLFTQKDLLLVYTDGKSKKKSEYKTTGKPFFDIDKIVVLIDENSASASEIMASAIKEWDRGLLIGRRTFGKGLVQEQYPLANGGALRITVARYYTPSGRSIQKSYSDLENYNYEIEDRYYNGELSNIKDSTNIKSSYKTLRLGRNLIDGGGVSPDIFVPIDSLVFTEKHHIANNLTYVSLLKVLSNTNIGQASLSKELLIDTVINQDSIKSIGLEIAVLKEVIEENLNLLQNDKSDFNMKDPFIIEALNFINTNKNLESLGK